MTFWNFIAMGAATIGVMYFVEIKDFAGFLAMFLILFVTTGVGNGSTYRMIPSIFREEKLREAKGSGESGRAARREGGQYRERRRARIYQRHRRLRRLSDPARLRRVDCRHRRSASGAGSLPGVLRDLPCADLVVLPAQELCRRAQRVSPRRACEDGIVNSRRRAQLVVVGNGMAGMRAVEELLSRAPDRYDITVIGAESAPNYNRILLSSVLAGDKTLDEIVINPQSWYDEHGIRLIAGNRATAIDRDARKVTLADGAVIPYDKLLLATGSKPLAPPIPGLGLAQCPRLPRHCRCRGDDRGRQNGAGARWSSAAACSASKRRGD